jgi:hypothetical protein
MQLIFIGHSDIWLLSTHPNTLFIYRRVYFSSLTPFNKHISVIRLVRKGIRQRSKEKNEFAALSAPFAPLNCVQHLLRGGWGPRPFSGLIGHHKIGPKRGQPQPQLASVHRVRLEQRGGSVVQRSCATRFEE